MTASCEGTEMAYAKLPWKERNNCINILISEAELENKLIGPHEFYYYRIFQ